MPGAIETTVKGLVFDEHGRVMLLCERNGQWDLPGGRLEHGETFERCLVRECREEMGVGCEVLDGAPRFAWCAAAAHDVWRVMLCFRIRLEGFDFTPSEECVGHGFFERDGLPLDSVAPQTRPLRDWL